MPEETAPPPPSTPPPPTDNLVETKHVILLDGQEIHFTATTGTLVFKEEAEKKGDKAGEFEGEKAGIGVDRHGDSLTGEVSGRRRDAGHLGMDAFSLRGRASRSHPPGGRRFRGRPPTSEGLGAGARVAHWTE